MDDWVLAMCCCRPYVWRNGGRGNSLSCSVRGAVAERDASIDRSSVKAQEVCLFKLESSRSSHLVHRDCLQSAFQGSCSAFRCPQPQDIAKDTTFTKSTSSPPKQREQCRRAVGSGRTNPVSFSSCGSSGTTTIKYEGQ